MVCQDRPSRGQTVPKTRQRKAPLRYSGAALIMDAGRLNGRQSDG